MAAKRKTKKTTRGRARKGTPGKGRVKTTGKDGSKTVVVVPPKAKPAPKKPSRKTTTTGRSKGGAGVPTRVGSDDKPAVVVNPPSDD